MLTRGDSSMSIPVTANSTFLSFGQLVSAFRSGVLVTERLGRLKQALDGLPPNYAATLPLKKQRSYRVIQPLSRPEKGNTKAKVGLIRRQNIDGLLHAGFFEGNS
ncbi:hypothetical protein MY3296_008148 [Beauveria thailandica]